MSINSVAIIILSQPKPLQFRTSTSINNFKGYMSFLAEGHFKENPEILHQIIYEICAILSLFLAKTKKKNISQKDIKDHSQPIHFSYFEGKYFGKYFNLH